MRSIVFLLFIISGIYVESCGAVESPFIVTNIILPCPESNDGNRSELEDFLTKPFWAEKRIATGTSHLANSQITLLIDSVDDTVCTTFNIQYAEAFEEKNGIGEQANDITYYKAGGFYFVIITPKQSEVENYIIFGTSYIDVYDQGLNFIKGYAF